MRILALSAVVVILVSLSSSAVVAQGPEDPGAIAGTVTGPGGAVEGIEVSVYDWSTSSWVNSATTLADGSYLVGDLPAATYVVRFRDETQVLRTEWYDGVANICLASGVSVGGGVTVTDIDAVLDPAPLPDLPGPQLPPAAVGLPEPPAAPPGPIEVVLKIQDDSGIRLRSGALVDAGGGEVVDVHAVLKANDVVEILRLFRQPEAELDVQRDQAPPIPGGPIPELNAYYRLVLDDGANADTLVAELLQLAIVETAYVAPRPAPPPTSPESVDFFCQQGYLNPAPEGVGAIPSWTQWSRHGEGVHIVDIEYAWNQDHEDLATVPDTLAGGEEFFFFGEDHGTAVLGVLVAGANGFGVTGGTFASTIGLVSPCTDSTPTTCTYNVASAVIDAIAATGPGDIILIEQQAPVCGLEDYGPVEYHAAEFDAISLATASGRIVVEAAGNGAVDLDQPACGGRFDRNVRDSGAIIVGAGNVGGPTDLTRAWYSSYGSRVDVQGWGMSVTTTGYANATVNEADPNRWYTLGFGGTSAASPIVTVAAALALSEAEALGVALTPQQVRQLLVETGTPQPPSDPTHIGPRPDALAAILALQPRPIAPNYLSVVDTGGDVAIFGRSPGNDLWYRETTSGAFGPWTMVETGASVRGRPVAVTSSGDLYVLYRGISGDLRYAVRPEGEGWQDVSLGGFMVGEPVAAFDGDGDLVVVVTGPGGAIWQRVLDAGETEFGPWTLLDGGFPDGRMAMTALDGDVLLVGLDGANTPWARSWSAATDSWSGWTHLGGGVLSDEMTFVTVDGAAYLTVVGGGGSLWYQVFDGSWSGWLPVDGGLASAFAAGGTSVLVVGGVNAEGVSWARTDTGAPWSPWEPLGGGLGSTPEIAGVAGVGVYYAGVAKDGSAWFRLFDTGTQTWGPWSNLGGGIALE